MVCSLFPGFPGPVFLKVLQAGSDIQAKCFNRAEGVLREERAQAGTD